MSKTYSQINKEIAALQAEAKKLYALELRGVVDKVNQVIAKYELSAADLKFSGHAIARATSKAGNKQAAAASTGAAKYSDGLGNVWGGRGPRPGWLRNAIASGRTLESFQAGNEQSASSPSKPMTAASATKTGNTSKATGKRPAKFKDDAGNSWSGRGSRPRWLQAALKKRGARIEDFLIDAPASSAPVAAPAGVAPASAGAKQLKGASRSSRAVKKAAPALAAAAAPQASKSTRRSATAKSKAGVASPKIAVKTPAAKAVSDTPAASTGTGAAPAQEPARKSAGPARKTSAKAAAKPVATKTAPAAQQSQPSAQKKAPVKAEARKNGKRTTGAPHTAPASEAAGVPKADITPDSAVAPV